MKRSIYSFFILLLFTAGCRSGEKKEQSQLAEDSSSTVKLDTIYPNTAAGKVVQEHIRASMGQGEDAEARYQQSLSLLRKEPGAGEALYITYTKVPEQYYLMRTLLVEGLKELHSPDALKYLTEIANQKIPANRLPENAEINTRQDEVVIRITAVEGISALAADSVEAAEKVLIALTGHEDLTVRQMAVRGYLGSKFGNPKEKIETLRRRLPEQEHWYITTDTTNIRQVPHPKMPDNFKLEPTNPTTPPKIK